MLRDSPCGGTSKAATVAVSAHDVSLRMKRKNYIFFKSVAKLHVSSQLRWRPLTYHHRGCRATSSTVTTVARWYILCWPPGLLVCLFLRGCTIWTGDIKCRKVKTGFCQKRQCKTVLLRLSLAGNLDTEIDCFLFTDPLPVKVAQHHNAPSSFW